jgi:hypothetical protein
LDREIVEPGCGQVPHMNSIGEQQAKVQERVGVSRTVTAAICWFGVAVVRPASGNKRDYRSICTTSHCV